MSDLNKYRQTMVNSGGSKKVAELLNAMEEEISRDLLEKLEQRNPPLGREVRKELFHFDDLVGLSREDLQRVIREQEKHDLVLSLKLTSGAVKEAIYASVSKGAAEGLREELSELGPVKLSQVEAAQQRIVTSVLRLKECGEITGHYTGSDDIFV